MSTKKPACLDGECSWEENEHTDVFADLEQGKRALLIIPGESGRYSWWLKGPGEKRHGTGRLRASGDLELRDIDVAHLSAERHEAQVIARSLTGIPLIKRFHFDKDCRLSAGQNLHDEQDWCESVMAKISPRERMVIVVEISFSDHCFGYSNFRWEDSDSHNVKFVPVFSRWCDTYIPKLVTECNVTTFVFLDKITMDRFRAGCPEFASRFKLNPLSFDEYWAGRLEAGAKAGGDEDPRIRDKTEETMRETLRLIFKEWDLKLDDPDETSDIERYFESQLKVLRSPARPTFFSRLKTSRLAKVVEAKSGHVQLTPGEVDWFEKLVLVDKAPVRSYMNDPDAFWYVSATREGHPLMAVMLLGLTSIRPSPAKMIFGGAMLDRLGFGKKATKWFGLCVDNFGENDIPMAAAVSISLRLQYFITTMAGLSPAAPGDELFSALLLFWLKSQGEVAATLLAALPIYGSAKFSDRIAKELVFVKNEPGVREILRKARETLEETVNSSPVGRQRCGTFFADIRVALET